VGDRQIGAWMRVTMMEKLLEHQNFLFLPTFGLPVRDFGVVLNSHGPKILGMGIQKIKKPKGGECFGTATVLINVT
jgi:hypothetical protein